MADPRLKKAVEYLIAHRKFVSAVRELRGIVEGWDKRQMIYGGELTFLNALVSLGIEQPAAFDRVIKLIEERRKNLPDIRRVDYQRTLMQQRRERVAKALELHELTVGHLTPDKRKAREKALTAEWRKHRDQYIERKGGKKRSWKERNALTQEFWAQIDRNLDMNLQVARRKAGVAPADPLDMPC